MRNRTSDLLNSLASSKLTIPTIYIYIDLVFSFSETVSLWEHLYSAIQIYDFDWLSFVVFALHERHGIARLASSYVLIAILSGRESTLFPSNGRLSTCYLLWSVIKIIIRKADVPSQIVIFSLFHNFYQTIMMLHRSVKTLRKKKIKYPQNLSLYHTVDIAGGSFVRILSKPEWCFLHFHSYSDSISNFS